MRGTFTTVQYDSRADFIEGRANRIHVVSNSFTDVGLRWMWEMMSGHLRQEDGTLSDHLGRARLVVGNGSQEFFPTDTRMAGEQTAQAELDAGLPGIEVVDGMGRLTLRAHFGEDEAVFEWQERGVVTAQGVLLDRAVGDQGRKPLGAVWQLTAQLEILR